MRSGPLGREPINLPGVRLVRVRFGPIATKFRSVGKCRECPSIGLRVRGIIFRRPERRKVPAKVQFEVARKTVTDTTDLRTARLRRADDDDTDTQPD